VSANAEDLELHPTDILDTPEAGARAIRGSALRTVGYIAGALLALASTPLMVRHLELVDAGRYFTVVSLVALIAGVTDVGLGAVAIREYSARTGAARDAYMRSILGARLILTGGGVVGALGFVLLAGYGSDQVLGTLLACVGLVLAVISGAFSVPLAAGLRVGWITGIDLAGKAVTVVLVVVLVLAGAGIVPFLAITVPVSLLALVVTAALARGSMPLRPSFSLRRIGELLAETLPLSAATMLNVLYARMVIVVMSLIATAEATGAFSTASRVVEVAVGIPVTLVGTTFPIFARAARDDRERLRYVLQRVLEVALIGGVWLMLALALTADPVADLLTRDPGEADQIARALRILAVAMVPVSLNITWQTTLLALRCHRELLIANAAALVVLVVLIAALVPPYGAEGAAVAVVLGETFLTGLSARALVRVHPGLAPALWLVGRVALALAAAAATVAITGVPAVAAAVLASLVYFGVLAAVGGMPGELRDAFAGLRRGPR